MELLKVLWVRPFVRGDESREGEIENIGMDNVANLFM